MIEGRITKQISNQYRVTACGEDYVCGARGKFRNLGLSPLVGDIVKIDEKNLTIEEILPRKNELDRPVVSNVDIALIVTSVKRPDLSLSLLDKELSVVLANNIKPVICLTKLDLLNKKECMLPTYNFLTGEKEYKGKPIKLKENEIIIIEGIHT